VPGAARRALTSSRGPLAAFLLLLALVLGSLASPTRAAASPSPWCGTGEPAADLPDAVSAIEWHVVYAIPAGGDDRFGYFAPRIAGDAADITNWWLGQDSTRRPRYDLIDAPGCASEPQRIDISVAHLPRPNAAESYAQIETDLRAMGFSNVDKGYLVYYDGSLNVSDEYGVCGQGAVADGPWAYSIIYLQACFQASSDDYRAVTAAHEMVHGMGAVETGAPHYCNSGHVCDGDQDLMTATEADGATLGRLTLDVGRDDYYGHSGNWYDVQDTGLLYDLDRTLPPPPAIQATATSAGTTVMLKWSPSTKGGDLNYRIYAPDGTATDNNDATSYTTSGELGQILTWTIRAEDGGGFLGPPSTVRFKVGYGLVDAAGALTKDTVPPGGVGTLHGSRSGATYVLRWTRAVDPGGIRGYRVTVAGSRPLLVRSTVVVLPLAKAKGKKVTVAAVDGGGNVGPVSGTVARG